MVPLFLCLILILQTSFAYEEYSEIVCEHETLAISCPEDSHIKIISANYGRVAPGAVICPLRNHDSFTNCINSGTISIVGNMCNKKQNCYIPATNGVFGDPCLNTFKYLEVKYKCVRNYMSRIVCEGTSLELSCPPGENLNIQGANYGRTLPGSVVCPQPHVDEFTECRSSNALQIVSNMCTRKPKCLIAANNGVFGDPCVNVYKYLDVQYGCFKHRNSMHVCEGGSLNLECPAGEHIKIISANYGRTRPGSEICPMTNVDHNTNCAHSSVDVAARSCNGHQKCSLAASNGVFGDPCVGTYKYLEVEYSCNPNSK